MIQIFSLLFFLSLGLTQNCRSNNPSDYPKAAAPFLSAKKLSTIEQAGLQLAYINSKSFFTKTQVQITNNNLTMLLNNKPLCLGYTPESLTFTTKDDIWVCFPSNFVSIACQKIWQFKINCGTKLQLHYPFSQEIVASADISGITNTQLVNLTMYNLCAGTYHLWLVYVTRIGRVLIAVQPIFISYPPCIC